jgi:hypothetical protein
MIASTSSPQSSLAVGSTTSPVIGRHYRFGTDPMLVAGELGIPVKKVIRYRTAYAQVSQKLDSLRRWG